MGNPRDRDDVARILLALQNNYPQLQPEVAPALKDVIKEYVNLKKWKIKKQLDVASAQNVPLSLDVGAPILRGGGGIVVQATNKDVPTLKYAIKAQRPSLLESNSSPRDSNRAFAEYIYHYPLASENIARLFSVWKRNVLTTPDTVAPKNSRIPFLILEWVDGATELSNYLHREVETPEMFVSIMRQSFMALEHLHSNNLIHWDIKSDNLLVNRSGTVKLMDIGNARRMDGDPADLLALTTDGNYPPILERFATLRGQGDSSNRIQLDLDSTKWDDPWLDMWMLARELVELVGLGTDDRSLFPDAKASWIEGDRKFVGDVFSKDKTDAAFSLAYIRLVLRRLLYPRSVEDDRYYRRAAEVVNDLDKLAPEFGAAQEVHELRAIPQKVVRIPVSGNVPLTGRIKTLISDDILTRLRRHWQLGTISEVYPGAAHKRFEHSLGVFSTTIRYLKALFADRSSVFWRISIEANDVEALLIAALMHDVGHLAYGHFLEEMAGLFKGFTHEVYAQAMLRGHGATESPGTQNRWEQSAARDHARLTSLVAGRWGSGGDPQAFLQSAADILVERESAAIAQDRNGENPLYLAQAELLRGTADRLKLDILHSIVESAIDADKFDYLRRDGLHSGIEYPSGIDADRFFQCLTTLHHVPGRSPLANRQGNGDLHASIAVTRKGLLPVESILFTRYQMFHAVYWHHTARAHTTMLQFCVVEYLSLSREDLDSAFQSLVNVFRHSTDDAAIAWLKAELSGRNPSLREPLSDACDALGGERKKAYKECFVLHYRGHSNVHRPEDVELIHLGLMRQFIELNEKSRREYIDAVRAFRKKFADALATKLGIPDGILDGEILLDIPPAGRDQASNIFVIDEGEAHFIQELSPMADAVSETFKTWARHFRVFCSPLLLDRAGKDREEFGRGCWDVLVEMYIPQKSMELTQREPDLQPT